MHWSNVELILDNFRENGRRLSCAVILHLNAGAKVMVRKAPTL